MNQKVNRITRCAGCKETFSYRYSVAAEPGEALIVRTTCPFCKKKLRIDLNPYLISKVISCKDFISYKGWGDEQDDSIELDWPDELPGTLDE